MKTIIEKGDIVTTSYNNSASVGRYQGNGRFGCVYSKLGLHSHPSEQNCYDTFGKTQFIHINHWGRFIFQSQDLKSDTSADYIIPTMRTYWETIPNDISNYHQVQSFYDGTLNTRFTYNHQNNITLTSWFDAVNRDLSAICLEVENDAPAIIMAPITQFIPYTYGYKDTAEQRFTISKEGDNWKIEITCLTSTPVKTSKMYIYSNTEIQPCPEGLKIIPQKGINNIYISYGEAVNSAEVSSSLSKTTEYWHNTWKNSGWLDLPDEHSQKMWVRSMAYILSTFNNDGISFAPTSGLTGNMFPFNFAQDMFYAQPTLLATGNVSVVKSWIEKFASILDDMKSYAKRLWPDAEGIYPPWELPYGPIDGYHSPSVPIFYCYEPHNSAYLCRMAHESAIMVNDPEWIQKNVIPLIREIALFYKSFCKKEEDGNWHLFITPSIGQDEAGGRNQKDYLCSLYSAKYSFQKALEYGLDTDGIYETILDDGLAFPNLLSEKGFFYASSGSGISDFGKQKHPVQLNGLAYLPVEPSPLTPERSAYEHRYETTYQANKPYFYGWTLGEFLLASSHIHDVSGWQKDWNQLRSSDYTDEDWVQIYETSSTTHQPFYIATHGLISQSLYNNIVSDYWGKLVIAPCNVSDGIVRFGNIHSLLGVKISGEIIKKTATITLQAWKDCEFDIHGIRIRLKMGETKELVLDI
jgi:hypothetical protein